MKPWIAQQHVQRHPTFASFETCLLYTSRVTDHRIGYTVNQLDRIMEGKMQDLLDALTSADQQAKLAGNNE